MHDTCLAAPLELMNDILTVFNSLHDRLRFTIEINKNDCIDFLDVTVIADRRGTIFKTDIINLPFQANF